MTISIPPVKQSIPAVTRVIPQSHVAIPEAVAPLSRGRFIVLAVAVIVAAGCVGGFVGAWLAVG